MGVDAATFSIVAGHFLEVHTWHMTDMEGCHVQVKALMAKQAMDRDNIRKLEGRSVTTSHCIETL